MKENEQIEQELLEEQLQAITGGCAACIPDRKSIIALMSNSLKAEKKLNNTSNPQEMQNIQRRIAILDAKVQQHIDTIKQRHPEQHFDLNAPGH